jgi:hypothetical protein
MPFFVDDRVDANCFQEVTEVIFQSVQNLQVDHYSHLR